jgi:hypothetical protein
MMPAWFCKIPYPVRMALAITTSFLPLPAALTVTQHFGMRGST